MNAANTALDLFRSQGVPHARIEQWKYSNLRAVVDADAVEHSGGLEWRIKTLPEGIEQIAIAGDAMPLWYSAHMRKHASAGAMEAAARAFARGGAAFRVARGKHVAQPLQLEFLAHGHGQVVLVLEEESSATLLEEHSSEGRGLRNISLAIFLNTGAELTHVRRAPYASGLAAIETIAARVEKDARYKAHFATLGARLSRTEINVCLEGEGGEAALSGVSVLNDTAHADITTHIDHAVGKTTSRQLFKKVAAGHSRAIYQGKITVREGANGSDSRQTAKALLLGARAEADLKPELEILADDVKCAHGAAIGELDTDSLFYLRSRGIAEREARAMLMRGFLEEAIAEIAQEDIRGQVWQLVESGLSRALGEAV